MNLKKFLFENQTIKQTIAKNTFWLFFGQIISRLIKAALVIYAARILGVEGYGLFSFALSYIMILAIFSDIGITPLLVREMSKNANPQVRQKYLSTSFYLKLGLLALFILLVFVGSQIAPREEIVPLLWILLFMMAFDILKGVFSGLAQSLEKMEIQALSEIAVTFFTTASGLIFLIFFPSPENLCFAYAIGAAAGFFILLLIFRRHLGEIFSNFDFELAKKILTWAWPFAFGSLIGSILIYTDSLMLGWMKSIDTVGLYSAALKIPQILLVPAGLIAAATFPAISRFAADEKKFKILVKKTSEMLLYLGLPLIAGGLILARPIMLAIFGEQYLPGVPVFQIIISMILFIYLSSILGNALFAKNLQKTTMIFSALAAGLNVLLNFLLIPRFSFIGAAAASVFTQLFNFGLLYWLFWKVVQRPPISLEEIKKPLLGAALMAGFLMIPSVNQLTVWISIPSAALIYFLLIWLLGAPFFGQINSLLKE